MIYTELPEDDIRAAIANVRSQFIGDPLYVQADKFRVIPLDGADFSRVFRWEQSVRESVTVELSSQLGENCLFSKFISSVTSGYVCYDSENGEIAHFYDNQYLRTGESE